VSAWCDYSGPADGKTAGIALLADPNNPVPTAWHSRNYGLMAANPFGRARSGFPDLKGKKDLVKLAKGEHLKFRYGLLLHSGDVKEGKVADYYKQFVSATPSSAATRGSSGRRGVGGRCCAGCEAGEGAFCFLPSLPLAEGPPDRYHFPHSPRSSLLAAPVCPHD
jgi:hypothetical protein